MIYTITRNPSLDYVVLMDSFEMGMTNRLGEVIFESMPLQQSEAEEKIRML